MNRIRIIGVCLAAVFALSAVSAASAAAEPTYKLCAKLSKVGAKYTGAYLDKYCEEPATTAQEEEGKANKYGLLSGAGTKFIGKAKTSKLITGTLENEIVDTVVCKKDSSTGEIVSEEAASETLTFNGCSLNGNKKERCSIPPVKLEAGVFDQEGEEEGELIPSEYKTTLAGETFTITCGATTLTMEGNWESPLTTGEGLTLDHLTFSGSRRGIDTLIDGMPPPSEPHYDTAFESSETTFVKAIKGAEKGYIYIEP